jgi:hypothetical protein
MYIYGFINISILITTYKLMLYLGIWYKQRFFFSYMSKKCVNIYYRLYVRLIIHQLLPNCRIIFSNPNSVIHVVFITRQKLGVRAAVLHPANIVISASPNKVGGCTVIYVSGVGYRKNRLLISLNFQ